MAGLVGRELLYQYEGCEPCLGLIIACNPKRDCCSVIFVDDGYDEAFPLSTARAALLPGDKIHIPRDWISCIRNALSPKRPCRRTQLKAEDAVGSIIIYKHRGLGPAVGIIMAANGDDSWTAEFTDGTRDTFTHHELQAMTIAKAAEHPKEWLQCARDAIKNSKEASTGKRHRRFLQDDSSQNIDELLANLEKGDRTTLKQADPQKRVRRVCAKAKAKPESGPEEDVFLVRWLKGGSEWISRDCLNNVAADVTESLPYCARRHYQLPFSEFMWVDHVIRSARSNLSSSYSLTEPMTVEFTIPQALPDNLVGTKQIDELPIWVPRIIGLEFGTRAGAITHVVTTAKPAYAFNFGHDNCEYCSYKLHDDLDMDGRMNPHLVTALTGDPNGKTVSSHCRCSVVHEYYPDQKDGAYRYSVRAARSVDDQMSLMRCLLRDGQTLDGSRS
eukprot:m.107913 g.107913  ORF g.107913 m.107913 type:complete len:444 (+) comp15324_c0_seq2:68-1399(+)